MSSPDFKVTTRPINLLLVDDHPGNLLALEAVLSDREYNLIMAHSGYEAIELMKTHEIALVLLDIQMPGMDGYETCTKLKEDPKTREIPIIFPCSIFRHALSFGIWKDYLIRGNSGFGSRESGLEIHKIGNPQNIHAVLELLFDLFQIENIDTRNLEEESKKQIKQFNKGIEITA